MYITPEDRYCTNVSYICQAPDELFGDGFSRTSENRKTATDKFACSTVYWGTSSLEKAK
jgi:hypothetical protein